MNEYLATLMIKRLAHITKLLIISLSITTLFIAPAYTSELKIHKPASPKKFSSALLLQGYFDQQDYVWPITSFATIPNTLLEVLPKDLDQSLSIKAKKTLFIRILLPIILAEQKNILVKRKRVITFIKSGGDNVTTENNAWLASLVKEYRINKSLNVRTQKQQLLKRIDSLPSELILAQAAIESGWGTSRFALEGNSLFGEWSYGKQTGLVPNNRQSGKNHQVKKFESLQYSVRSYMNNINRNNAYKELRTARAEMRKNSEPLDAKELANHLHRYSQKGQKYVDTLHQILSAKELRLIKKLTRIQPNNG